MFYQIDTVLFFQCFSGSPLSSTIPSFLEGIDLVVNFSMVGGLVMEPLNVIARDD